ncbi:MAG: penicillin-binding protein 2 [Fimbriimonadaceae bacterium]|nr:penicillin-binding protein 2 [Fimbriimonadaceae bacterium]
MSVIHAPRRPELDLRQMWFLIVVGVWLVVIFLRLWYLQVVRADELQSRAVTMRTTSVAKLAPRGLIYDRNGVLIAGIKPQIVLTAKPAIINQNPWVLDKIAEMLGTSKTKLQDKVNDNAFRPYIAVPIFVGVPIEQATKIAEAGQYLPGVGVEYIPMRTYTDTLNYSHILGYVWTPSEKDVQRLEALGIKTPDYVGKNGVEYQYETALMGVPGLERMEVDARRRPQRVVERDNAVPGTKLILSIDDELQKYAYEQLRGRKGAVVALDPNTGEVLCLVSAPTFDSKLFEGGISKKDWEPLINDPDKPLYNRAVLSHYSPGSTFKIVDSISAAQNGLFDPRHYTVCNGYYKVGNRLSKCLGNHGAVSFDRAFTVSCNTYFSDLGMRIGPEALKKSSLECGLGQDTLIDLPSEDEGVVPTQEWLEKRDLRWYPGDTVNMSIGQGALAATPLQMACIAALVANNGVSYRPHLVRARILPGPENKTIVQNPEVLAKVDLPGDFWRQLKDAMTHVMQSGTGRGIPPIPNVVWGGKTGSTEHAKASQTHSWFVGIAPIDQPKIVVAVIVEAAGHGSKVAAPVARNVIAKFLSPKQGPIMPTADVETEVRAIPNGE